MSGSGSSTGIRLKKVHKYMDAKPQFLWWEIDELVILTLPLMLGIITENVLPMVGFSLVAVKIYSKMKSSKQEGYMRHFMYHHGFLKMPGIPEAWVKEFTE